MRLGELLLQQNLVSKEGLEEALESQVLNGGRLGTNLCELGLLQEKDLAKALGQLHNVAFASGEMHPDPQALELVGPQFADDKDLLPMRIDPTRLILAVMNPHDDESFHAIGFKTGLRVVPVVVPEFRMNQLLRRHCKAFRDIRPIDMNTLRPSKTLGTLKGSGPRPLPAEELINEEEFQKLYAQAMVGGPAGAQVELEAAEIVIEAPELLEAADITIEMPAPLPVAPPPPAPLPPPRAPAAMPRRPGAPLAMAPPAVRPPPPEAQPAPAAPEPPATPITFPDAQRELQQIDDREGVARTVLRFAIGKWKRALILSVQGDLVTGWRGMGQGVETQAVRRIGISVRTGQSTFKLVRDSRSHYIGPMKRDAGTQAFYNLLGAGFPSTAVLLPLLVRGKVVHVLYVDNGPDQLTPPDIGELLILSQSVARSYEAMIRRRKSA